MPGPQLRQAIPFTKKIRELYPSVVNIWGGYFPSNHSATVLNSGYVDFIINGMGDKAFPQLISALSSGGDYSSIPNIIYKNQGGIIVKTKKDEIYNLDELPDLPYNKLDRFYPLTKYLGKTWLGKKTIAYHSSFGCPFTCSFCAVVPIYNARWKGKSASKIYEDIRWLRDKYHADAIEFHDNNFFVSEKRVVEFSKLIMNEKMVWWGEGRIDTIDKYSDESLALMREAGCKMIFFGAETGSDEILRKMDKGGTQSAEQILRFAARMKKFDIIPEYSFVLGIPQDTEEKVFEQIERDIAFIRRLKEINPSTEIIIYVYSPVPTEGSDMFKAVEQSGFKFPTTLDEWISAEWESFDLRKNPLTPWLKPYMVDRIKNFEAVLNGYYPTVTDIKMTSVQTEVSKLISSLRYKAQFYKWPYEIKAYQKLIRYRQPEKEGF